MDSSEFAGQNETIRVLETAATMEKLSEDVKDFWVDSYVPVLTVEEGESLEVAFLREGVSRYHPVIIRGLMDDWPAMKWTPQSLCDLHGEEEVSVNLTADGRADSVQWANHPKTGEVGQFFIYPAEGRMPLKHFFSILEESRLEQEAEEAEEEAAQAAAAAAQEDDSEEKAKISRTGPRQRTIAYLSEQNDNLRQQFPSLLQEIDPSNRIQKLAKAAWNVTEPEAMNLWIGDASSVSSLHKDYFENLYAVVSGEKIFTLLPPTDIPYLPEDEYECLKYRLKSAVKPSSDSSESSLSSLRWSDRYHVELSADEEMPSKVLKWIDCDPNDPHMPEIYPPFSMAHPIHVRVQPGEILYLPAMWYHRVSQTKLTIAVNYWFDQRFDFRYAFFNMAEGFSSRVRAAADKQLEETLESHPKVQALREAVRNLQLANENAD